MGDDIIMVGNDAGFGGKAQQKIGGEGEEGLKTRQAAEAGG